MLLVNVTKVAVPALRGKRIEGAQAKGSSNSIDNATNNTAISIGNSLPMSLDLCIFNRRPPQPCRSLFPRARRAPRLPIQPMK